MTLHTVIAITNVTWSCWSMPLIIILSIILDKIFVYDKIHTKTSLLTSFFNWKINYCDRNQVKLITISTRKLKSSYQTCLNKSFIISQSFSKKIIIFFLVREDGECVHERYVRLDRSNAYWTKKFPFFRARPCRWNRVSFTSGPCSVDALRRASAYFCGACLAPLHARPFNAFSSRMFLEKRRISLPPEYGHPGASLLLRRRGSTGVSLSRS